MPLNLVCVCCHHRCHCNIFSGLIQSKFLLLCFWQERNKPKYTSVTCSFVSLQSSVLFLCDSLSLNLCIFMLRCVCGITPLLMCIQCCCLSPCFPFSADWQLQLLLGVACPSVSLASAPRNALQCRACGTRRGLCRLVEGARSVLSPAVQTHNFGEADEFSVRPLLCSSFFVMNYGVIQARA